MNQVIPNKSKKPIVYYMFWVLFAALIAILFWFSYQNIIPYEIVVRRIFKVSSNPIGVFNILGQRGALTLAWLVATVFWLFLQGLQVAYLLLTQSEKAMDFLIKKAGSHGTHGINENDPNLLKTAKRQYNEAPLAVLKFLAISRLFAYGIEIAINFSAYPMWDGGLIGFFMALIDWSRFRLDNAVMLLVTLIAVEYTVFAAIMVWRLIEVLKHSGAYNFKNPKPQ